MGLKLTNYIRLQVGETRAYIFIDEIQRKKDAGLFLYPNRSKVPKVTICTNNPFVQVFFR